MHGEFDERSLAQWCEIYVRFVIKDRQRLAAVIGKCSREKLQSHLEAKTDASSLLTKTDIADDDYLIAYSHLQAFDTRFRHKPHWHLLDGFIEIALNDTRYILTRWTEHPIAKAIPESQRFKRDNTLGTKGLLQLNHHWQEVDRSTELTICRSDVFDAVSASIKIGLSPFADYQDMNWRHAPEDLRGIDKRTPFWCSGAKDEAKLLERLIGVLSAARDQQAHILLFPELVMTETLQTRLQEWLKQHNAFDPIIRLVIAGTRHVFDADEPNTYSNRCTAFNHIGDIEWQQDKSQPFDLPSKDAALLGIQFPAFEPTQLSRRLVIRHTALGNVATPICLDFLCDELWKAMPVDIFFVPAMSSGLSRFNDNCRIVGTAWGASAFVCNAQPDQRTAAILAYRPSKEALQSKEQSHYLFTVEVDIAMNNN